MKIRKMPRFDVIEKGKSLNGILREDFSYDTLIIGHRASTTRVVLLINGLLTIRRGYVWDFGSGPVIDTPEMIAASLIHDALYELMVSGVLSWRCRKAADQLLRKLLIYYGAPKIRAWWVYWGVRIGYPILRFFGVIGRKYGNAKTD